jgi:outer membrane protein TolC
MFVTRWKHAAFVGLTVALLAVGGAAGNPVPAPKEPSPEDVAKLKALLKERVDALTEAFKIKMEEYKAGVSPLHIVLEVGTELRKAELDLYEKPEERLDALKKNLKLLQMAEGESKTKFDAGRVTKAEVAMSKAARLEAEIALLREQMKVKTGSK